jgi:hypothetical protein
LGLCIVAATALCGLLVATASASAESLPKPVWASCAKASPKDTGKYKNKTCSEAEPSGKGGYELVAGIGKGKVFKGKTVKGEKTELIVKFWEGRLAITCESGKDEGTPVAPNLEKKVTAEFSKCIALNTPTKVCTTAGAKKGEVKVTGLEGELGYTEEGVTPKVGVELKSENVDGVMSEFNCEEGSIEGKILGEVINEEVGNVGVVTKDSDAVFAPGEFYGEHEFDEKTYTPEVNIIGWAEERPEIERCEAKPKTAGCEEEHPAHVLKGEFCGRFVEGVLGAKCTPPTYVGLKTKFVNKGEALEIKV